MEFYVGQIIIFGGNFAIRNMALAKGQLLPIEQNTALFSLYGTMYGGDGRTSFALPDLQGRTPIGAGSGPGLNTYNLGEKSGTESIALTHQQLPSHTHALRAVSVIGDTNNPQGAVLANTGSFDNEYKQASPDVSMSAEAIGSTGAGQSFNIRNPYLGINYLVNLTGLYPSRN